MQTKILKIISCLLLFASSAAYAQPGSYDPDKVNKKAIDLYEKALDVAQDEKYREALTLLQQAVKKDPRYLEAYLSIAGLYAEMKKHDSAVINYQIAKNIDTSFFQEYNLPYSI